MSSAFAHMTTGLAGGIPSGMGMPPPPAAYNAALSHSQSYAGSSAAATAANTDPLYSPAAIDEFHRWLLQWKHVSTQYELVLSALRKRQLVGAQACAKATAEVVRAMLGSCKFQTTEHMMRCVRIMGKELTAANASELVVGNVVRRVLFIIREEYSQKLRTLDDAGFAAASVPPTSALTSSHSNGGSNGTTSGNGSAAASNSNNSNRSRSNTLEDVNVLGGGISKLLGGVGTPRDRASSSLGSADHDNLSDATVSNLRLNAAAAAASKPLAIPASPSAFGQGGNALSPVGKQPINDPSHQPSLGTMLGRTLSSPNINNNGSTGASPNTGTSTSGDKHATSTTPSAPSPGKLGSTTSTSTTNTSTMSPSAACNMSTIYSDFCMSFPDLRQAVVGAVNEMFDEIDSLMSSLTDSAADLIHEDECILTVGNSPAVELFLKAAARKRKFQVVICECDSGVGNALSGHKLAAELSQNSRIAVTVVPDAAVFAMMARINKVIFSPSAVLADGGALAAPGTILLAAIAAKEYSVPVVGIAGTYKLTPLFSHAQEDRRVVSLINDLVSPAESIRYDQDGVDFRNVDVRVSYLDYMPPELINLYVTNNGSHQPSYIYRLMSEYYHPKDYQL